MNTILRPSFRLSKPIIGLRRPPLAQPALYTAILLHSRTIANHVGPGSTSLKHAAQNIKEEAGNSAADLAKRIAGANVTSDAVVPEKKTFFGITNQVASSVPKPVMVFGLAGGLPYVAASATTVYLANQAGKAASGIYTNIDPGVALTILDQALTVQVTYGAVMLSFLGALHWGMEFSGQGGYRGYSRLLLGAAPVIFAWPTLALQPTMALAVQWAGFTALWWADSRATMAGWTPLWYSQYRFYLSVLVGTCILGSLAGITYYGPVAGHGLLAKDLDLIRFQRMEMGAKKPEVVGGPVEAVPGEELEADSYVVLRKVPEDEHEGEGEGKDEGKGEGKDGEK